MSDRRYAGTHTGSYSPSLPSYLIVKRSDGNVVAFVHFRFTRVGEAIYEPIGPLTTFVYDLHVLPSLRRKGVGKWLMSLLCMITKKCGLPLLTVDVKKGDRATELFLSSAVSGFEQYESKFDEYCKDYSAGAIARDLEKEDTFKLWSRPTVPFPKEEVAAVDTVASENVPPPVPVNVVAPPTPSNTPAKAAAKAPDSTQEDIFMGFEKSHAENLSALRADHEDAVAALCSKQKKERAALGENTPGAFGGGIDLSGLETALPDEESEEEDATEEVGEFTEEDEVLQSLIDAFTEKQGRAPMEDEIKLWVDTLREASEEAMVGKFGSAAAETPERPEGNPSVAME